MVKVGLVLWEINHLPSLYHFAFSLAMNESDCCFTSTPAFVLVSVFNFNHFNRYIVVYHCCLVYNFLIIWYWAYFCILTTWIFSLIRCLLRSFDHFLIKFFFLLLRFKSSSYILHNSLLLDTSLTNISSKSVVRLFIFFIS